MSKFEIQTLSENQTEEWLDHLDRVFTNTPRRYFADHLLYDDDDLYPLTERRKSIFVAIHNQKIISTVRVFQRKAFFQKRIISCGGIGEVSTNTDFRGQGLASDLLKRAIQFLQNNQVQLSTLHTGAAAPLYEKHGWTQCIYNTRQEQIQVFLKYCSPEDNSCHNLDFQSPSQIRELCQIHNEFSAQFDGPFHRTPEYWTSWIAHEFERNKSYSAKILKDSNENILGFLALRIEINEPAVVADFCCRKDKVKVFATLMNALRTTQPFSSIIFPAALFKDQTFTSPLQQHLGYMYQRHQPKGEDDVFPQEDNHLFWKLDGF